MPHVCAHSGSADLARLSDDDLLDLLEEHGDTLPLAAIEECARRADSMLQVLTEFLKRHKLWSGADGGAFWLPVHATCVLACIGAPGCLPGLVAALDGFVKTENEWLMDEFPAIFAGFGPAAVPPLVERATSRRSPWLRQVALRSLAAIVLRHPECEGDGDESWRKAEMEHLRDAFAQSKALEDLPAVGREDAVADLPMFVRYMVDVCGSPPWAWTRQHTLHFLLEHFPAQESIPPPGEVERLRQVPEALARFILFWAEQGEVPDVHARDGADAARELRDAFLRDATNPEKFGDTKRSTPGDRVPEAPVGSENAWRNRCPTAANRRRWRTSRMPTPPGRRPPAR